MTCVCAYKHPTEGIWLAADSRAGESDRAISCATPKIGGYDGYSIAFAGSYRLGQVLLQAFRPPKHPANISTDDFMFTIWVEALKSYMEEYAIVRTESGCEFMDGSEVIIVYRDEIYTLQMDFSLLKSFENFMASGSGSSYATGVLYALNDRGVNPSEIVKTAIACAIEHSPDCGVPIIIMKHDPLSPPKPRSKSRKKKAALSQTASGSITATIDKKDEEPTP